MRQDSDSAIVVAPAPVSGNTRQVRRLAGPFSGLFRAVSVAIFRTGGLVLIGKAAVLKTAAQKCAYRFESCALRYCSDQRRAIRRDGSIWGPDQS